MRTSALPQSGRARVLTRRRRRAMARLCLKATTGGGYYNRERTPQSASLRSGGAFASRLARAIFHLQFVRHKPLPILQWIVYHNFVRSWRRNRGRSFFAYPFAARRSRPRPQQELQIPCHAKFAAKSRQFRRCTAQILSGAFRVSATQTNQGANSNIDGKVRLKNLPTIGPRAVKQEPFAAL